MSVETVRSVAEQVQSSAPPLAETVSSLDPGTRHALTWRAEVLGVPAQQLLDEARRSRAEDPASEERLEAVASAVRRLR